MSARLRNTLTAERERLGWSQSRMADAAGISRQSYAAIESGRSVPSAEIALRLSAALGRSVGDLFSLPQQPAERRAAAWSGVDAPVPGHRVRLTRIGGRWIAHPCAEAHRPEAPADGVVEGIDGGEVGVRLFPDRPPPSGLAVVGCDPAFGIVADGLRRHRGIDVSWSQRGSRAALVALARGEAHVAGAHLQDAVSGAWNGPAVHQLVPFPCTRISFAVWEQGLLVRPDTTRRIGGIGDLADGRARLLNREEGSGSRALLDETLAAAGVEPAGVAGYTTTARGHFSVADGIAAGAADAGVAIRAAGRARGLDVLPLREEAYELIVPDHFLDLPAVDALIGLLHRPGVRAQVEALGGYDAATMGRIAS
jgi:molybdopterin molybdotransferase/putative molybdopterin biosynthesis protein